MKYIWFFYKRLHAFSGKILYINMFAMIIIGLLESAGTLLLIPMISMSGIIDMDIGAMKLPNWFSWFHDLPKMISLTIVLGAYLSIVLLQGFIQRKLTIRDVKIRQEYIRHLRIKLYESLLHANWGFFIKKRKSDLINVLTTDLARVNGGINLFLKLLASSILTIIQIALAFWLSTSLTLFVLTGALVLSFFSRRFIKQSKELGKRTSQLALNYLAGVTDQLNGIKEVKSNQLEKSHIHWLRHITNEMNEEQIEYTKLNSASQLSFKISSALLIQSFYF